MSVFTEEDAPKDNPLEELVGEGKKFKDLEALAKGKIESDNFIEELKRQINELKEDLVKNRHAEELLKELKNTKAVEPKTSTLPVETLPKEADLESLVESVITKRERESTALENIRRADRELEELYGAEAKSRVLQKSNELGISLQRLKEIAQESPTAFLALVGGPKETPQGNYQKGTVNTESLANTKQPGVRDWSYYSELRKKNPQLYYTGKIQQQLLEDRGRLGDSFYKR